MNLKNLQTAGLEALRLLVFSVPGILVQVISGDAVLAAWGGGALVIALKSWDRSVHENPNTQATGILPF